MMKLESIIHKLSSLVNESMVIQITPYEKWEWLNLLTLMFMKLYINKSIKAPISDYLKTLKGSL